jgi:hypothetical protein
VHHEPHGRVGVDRLHVAGKGRDLGVAVGRVADHRDGRCGGRRGGGEGGEHGHGGQEPFRDAHDARTLRAPAATGVSFL